MCDDVNMVLAVSWLSQWSCQVGHGHGLGRHVGSRVNRQVKSCRVVRHMCDVQLGTVGRSSSSQVIVYQVSTYQVGSGRQSGMLENGPREARREAQLI